MGLSAPTWLRPHGDGQLLPPDDPRALLDPALWPAWLAPAEAAGQVLIVVLSALEFGGAWPPVVLLVASLVPWTVWHLGVRVPSLLLGALVLLPLAAVTVRPEAFGWVDASAAHGPHMPMMLLVLFAFHAGVAASRRDAILLGAGITAIPLARLAVVPAFGEQVMLWLVALGLGLTGGVLLAHQTRLVLQLRAAQAALVEEAGSRERRRIAREVHDVIAHSLAVTMLQVNAARMANDRGEPAKVAEALRDAERVGRASLDEVRGTVQLLRDGDDPTTAALPTAADVGSLLDEHRRAGMQITGDPPAALADVDGAVGLATFRVVQEALTNAARHAPGHPVTIDVAVDPDAVTVTVDNALDRTLGDTGPGMGIVGMRERVKQLDGRLEAGPRDGRWHVVATIPRPAAVTGGTTEERGWHGPRPRC